MVSRLEMKVPSKYFTILWVSIPVFIVDYITKRIIHNNYALGETTPVIPGFFSITYVRNKGAAFGFMANAPDHFRTAFLNIVPLFALVMVAMFFRSVPPGKRLMPIALSLVIGGALGNLLDRFYLGYVIDFLDFFVGTYHWPAFNVADSAICVGISLMAYHMLFLEPKEVQADSQ